METKDIKKLIDNCSLPDTCENVELRETHISWLILTDNYAFKVKKPVKFSFLDFSTPEKRHFFCQQELKLNKRLAPEMYIKVMPIAEGMLANNNNLDVVDYAVQMERKDNDREMATMLKNNRVSENDINNLARIIADFHQSAEIVKNAFDTTQFQENFADINGQLAFIGEKLGPDWAEKVKRCSEKSNTFLNKNRSYFNERIISGLHRDGHGDLNSHNIFIYEPPMVFDCIEYNKSFRQIDVLNDIAFLTVDLDFFDQPELSQQFYEKYKEHMGFDHNEKDEDLYLFYKSYRANIRAKVTLISAQNEPDKKQHTDDIKKYINLMASYMSVE